eukprot:gene7246-8630_t
MLAVAGLSFVRLYMVQVSAAKFVGEDSGFFHATASTISTDCPAGCDLMSHVARLSQAIPAFAHIDNNKDGNISFHEYAGVLEAFQELLNQTINQSTREGVYVVPPSLKDELERRSMFHGGRRRVMSEDDSAGSELEANSTSTNSGVTYINSTELGQEQLSEVNRTLSLEGDCGDLSCLVDGGHGGPLVTINQDGNVTISKLSLKHFSNSDGGVVVADSGTIIAIADCNITDCVAEDAGGFLLAAYNVLTITNCDVSENSAAEDGGVMFVEEHNAITFTACNVTWNAAEDGGVVKGEVDNNITFIDSGVCYNHVLEARLCQFNCPTLPNCTILRSHIHGRYCLMGSIYKYGGVVFVNSNNVIVITNTVVDANVVDKHGGVVYGSDDNVIVITDSVVSGNRAEE